MKSVRVMAAFAAVACTADKPPASPDDTSAQRDTVPAVSVSAGDMVLNLFDELGSATTRAKLAARFGPANVVDTVIYMAEGERRPGSVLFAGDSSRRLEITWIDSIARARPATIHLDGTASIWSLPHGISLGTSLSDLERLNGRPFTILGFGWDYGGTITDWRGGSLSSLKSGTPTVFLRLSPQVDGDSPDRSAVMGDNEFSSNLAAMKRLSPVVDRIAINYERAP